MAKESKKSFTIFGWMFSKTSKGIYTITKIHNSIDLAIYLSKYRLSLAESCREKGGDSNAPGYFDKEAEWILSSTSAQGTWVNAELANQLKKLTSKLNVLTVVLIFETAILLYLQ